MDRALSAADLARRSRRRRLAGLAIVATFLVAVFGLRSWIRPSIDREAIRTARVERGEVTASISAAGQVVPLEEQVLSALVDSEVLEVLAPVGAEVTAGQAVVRLDGRGLELEIAELREQLALKENLRRAERLRLEESQDASRSRLELLKIDLESRQTKHTRFVTLAAAGVISGDQLYEAELDVTRTSVEIAQLERAMRHAAESAETELERIDLETAILRGQRSEKERQLAGCTVRAPRAGVVTWVLDDVGTRAVTGAALARLADLSTFRIEAQVSDFYASTLRSGLPVEVSTGGITLGGEVAAILPTVEGGQMKLQVDLEDPSHSGLRPQLRVDVEVVTGRVADGLGLKNGPAIGSNGRQIVYRIVDGFAERTEVELGMASPQRVQVLAGLEEGDEVILSDTRDIDHLQRVRVKGES
ncbi:MAG: efflux RND transporter periplasmic adaptor subunit [Acidobacteriota bacterium]